MVATLTWVLAPALIRPRSYHHYEVRLGLEIIFMYNMSIYGFLGEGMVAMDMFGLAPAPGDIWAEVRPSGRHQTAQTKP